MCSPAGSVSTRCMSMGRGLSACWVIDDDKPSTKNRTAQNSPTPRTTPAIVDSVRRGSRTSSAQTYLRRTGAPQNLHDAASVEANRPLEAFGNRGVVRDDDERGPEVLVQVDQQFDDPSGVVVVERAG